MVLHPGSFLGDSMGEKALRRWLTLDEAFEMSNVTIKSLRKAIGNGTLPAYKPGKRVLIDVKDLESFIKRAKL